MFLNYVLLVTIIIPNVLCAPPRRLIKCIDMEDRYLDWFLIYKLSKNENITNLAIKEGIGYLVRDEKYSLYLDQVKNITSPDNILAKTLAPLYEQNRDEKLEWILYNDQPPNKPYISDFGHAKGVFLFNGEEGVWLVHSVPHFPPEPNEKFEFPKTGYRYAQTLFCMSVRKEEFDNIGLQLKINEINVYSHKISNETATLYPNLADAARQVRNNNGETFRQSAFKTSQGYRMQSFAKSSKWNKELWSDLVAPSLNVSLYVQSWLNEADRLNSTCDKPNQVYNIKTTQYDGFAYQSTNDHSKWAIAVDVSGPKCICFGDINRAESQFKRGGGAVCLLNDNFFMMDLKKMIYVFEECPKT